MAKVTAIQSTFNAGEVSPLLYGRVELEQYRNALAVCVNCLPLVQGPLTRRPGFYFSDEVKDSSVATRLIAFKYSTVQAYVLEFGNQYIRFKRNNGPVKLTGQAITGITQANPGVVTYSGADTYANGDHVDISGVAGMTQVNGRRFQVANVNAGANTFELFTVTGTAVNTSTFTTYSSGGLVEEVYEIASPYAAADLFQLKTTQSADTLYIDHPLYAPRKLTRSGHTNWTLSTITFLDGPYLPTNTTTTTLTPSAATGSITLTASAVTGINSDAGFKSTDVGRLIRLKEGSTWGYVRITGFTNTTVVSADVITTLTNLSAKATWRLGLWSDTTGYPAVATFHDDRLFHAGNTSNQQRLDGSNTGDYENFAPTQTDGTVTDSHALSFSLNSDDVQVVRWMKSDEKALLTGTAEGEWTVRPSAQNEGLTPTNVNAKQVSPYGSFNTSAIRAGKSLVFVQKAGRKVRELAYVFQDDGFLAPDLTVLAEHITKAATAATSGIKELAWQQEPQSMIWAPRNDGVLLCLLYERGQKVTAWSRHTLGGYSDAGKTSPPVVESVATIPAADGTRDEVWVTVRRYINGRTVRTVEYLTKIWEVNDAQNAGVYGDCALTYNGAAATTLTGLFHLAGETVGVLTDGAEHPDVVVSATGTITLNHAASMVHVGYRYNSDGQTLRMDAGAADGSAQGKLQRAHRVVFRWHDTGPVAVGSNFNTSGVGKLTTIAFRQSADLTATAVPLFRGDKEIPWDGGYSANMQFCWRWSGMSPGTLVGIYPRLHTQDA